MNPQHRRDAGFSLAALIFFATAASILAAAAYPAYQMQAKREAEEELIFRGEEYTRAIQKYQRRFGIYPTSVEQLLETNGLRFLRRAYKDPVTDKEFRLIYVNPDGSLTGSTLSTQNVGSTPLFGGNPLGQPPQTGQRPTGQQSTGQQPTGQQSPGQQPPGLQPVGQQRPGQQSPGQQPLGSAPRQQNPNPRQPAFGSSGVPGGQTTPVGGLIGVASDSERDSIKIYNQRQKYKEWEFIAILGQPGQQQLPGQQTPGQQMPGQQVPGQMPGQQMPGQPMPGQQTPGQSPGRPGQTPTGTQTPFGQAPNTPFGNPSGQQIQQPFGFGNPPQQPQQPNQPVKR